MSRSRPRHLVWLLAAATLIPIGVLSWMTVQLLRQDDDVERQRRRDALEVAAGRVAIDIERRLQRVEAELAAGRGVRFIADGIVPADVLPLLFQPQAPADDFQSPELTAVEIDYEYGGSLAAARDAYRRLASSADERLRGEALLRLARTLRKLGDRASALSTYDELAALGDVPVAAVPAALLGSFARGRLLEQGGDSDTLASEGVALARLLSRGGWRVDRDTFNAYAEDAERWGGPGQDDGALSRTEALVEFWLAWRRGSIAPAGRQLSTIADTAVLTLWTTTPDGVVAAALPASALESALESAWADRPVLVTALDRDGRPLFGSRAPDGLSLLPSGTGLPFVLDVAPGPELGRDDDLGRRVVLLSTLGLAFALMLAAGYGLYRTTTREMSLANEQADFVSAVSHEFRTPLTSMRHIVDLLANRGAVDDTRRAYYYHLLADETERLQRMVETLLSFGRIEAGAYRWQRSPVDVAGLMTRTVEHFRSDPLGRGRVVNIDVPADLPVVIGDEEALERALWNLIENAAKYSEQDRPIEVAACQADDAVTLEVRDQGTGIDPADRTRIFEKFVRGAGAANAGARGVGIGLALVKTIVTAHGGTVDVHSEPGRGSTFRIVLPADGAHQAAGKAPVTLRPSTDSGRPERVEGRS